MSIFCWGSTINGELGLGGIEDEHVCDGKRSPDREYNVLRILSADSAAPRIGLVASGEHRVDLLRSIAHALPVADGKSVFVREQRLRSARTRLATEKATYVDVSYVHSIQSFYTFFFCFFDFWLDCLFLVLVLFENRTPLGRGDMRVKTIFLFHLKE